eukprot:2814404-Rhodomonas_salina.1
MLHGIRDTIQAANDGVEAAGAALRVYADRAAEHGTAGAPVLETWLAEVEDACRKQVAVACKVLQSLVMGPRLREMGKN